MVTKKTQGIFSNLFVLGWKFFDFVPRASSAFRNLSTFPALDFLLLNGLGKRLKFHINVQQGLKNSLIGC